MIFLLLFELSNSRTFELFELFELFEPFLFTSMLQGKHILIGISGGIAAYKIPELIRMLRKAGAEVKVCTTRNVLEFVTPLVLETISGNKVYSDVFATGNDHTTEHVSLPDWADAMIVAPATANVVGKMAVGIADDALTTTFLAMARPVLVAPAMNENMYAHPAVQTNLRLLASMPHVTVMDCASGFLACGTEGKGRMQEIDAIYRALLDMLTPKTMLGRNVLITAGPTQEKIDPVRYISNYSTGKMGIALAEQCVRRGAAVTLVLGPTAELVHLWSPRFEERDLHKVIRVTSATEMHQAAKEAFPKADVAILCAAVADYAPAEVATEKIKRGKNSSMELSLVQNPDISAELGAQKRENQVVVGFALETNDEETNALGKMERKNLDMIVLNSLQEKGAGFGVDTNKVAIYTRTGSKREYALKQKQQVAKDVLDVVEILLPR